MTLSYDKILLRAALCMLTLLLTGACSRRGPVLTFREADDPTADTLADWSGVASGLHAAWGTTDKRYARSVVPLRRGVRMPPDGMARRTGFGPAGAVERRQRRRRGVPHREIPAQTALVFPPESRRPASCVTCSPTRSVRAAATAGTAISLFRSRPTCSTRSAASTWMRAPRVRCG